MADKERNALIPLPAGGLENIGSGPKSILSGMVSDALVLARVREKSSSNTVQHSKQEWQQMYPGMSDQTAQNLADNPPPKPTEKMIHGHEFYGED